MSLLDAAGVVTGDIWCTGAFSFESPLKDLLDSGSYTLEQLLAEDELLQELRGIHPQLIDYFSTEEAAAGLIQYVILPPGSSPPTPFAANNETVEDKGETSAEQDQMGAGGEVTTNPPNDSNTQQKDDQPSDEDKEQTDKVFVRFPYMACEVICCEITGIIDTIVDGHVPAKADPAQNVISSDAGGENAEVTLRDSRPNTILDLLFSMLYDSQPGEVDDYRAGYFDKVLSVLFRKRPQALSAYVNEGGGRGNVTLMKAMFKHLYSHSIMQIVQRLLLPQPPLPISNEDDPEKEGDELYSDTLEAADLDGMGAFRCNWSESQEALELLLECLVSVPATEATAESGEEQQLSLCQNASEVLITIIQNSPLTSPTLNTLTTDPVMGKLIMAASYLEEGKEFSPHDSSLTCTMNVLESLILQLGGYGSVGTVMLPEDDEGEEGAEGMEAQDGVQLSQPENSRQEIATSDTLISHLPVMLSNLCKLLLHPSSERWESPMQFSKSEPQKILGSSRLRIVRLLESLVLLGDPNVDALLCESNCLEICLDLFWQFQWCSMLHQSVANLLVHVFEGANARSELQSYFMVKCNLLGRLMDSFWEISEDGEIVKRMDVEQDDSAQEDQESVKSESRVDNEADNSESRDEPGKLAPDGAPAQSFRLGYMGHVIIICQALVHACTNDGEKTEGDPSEMGGGSAAGTSTGDAQTDMNGELGRFVRSHNNEDGGMQERGALHEALERGRAADSVVTEETPYTQNTLILAQLVETHPLRIKWQDFVTTTLASETAIQSTPLGGFHGAPGGMDPLHTHRPGLPDDADYADDDGAAPPLPPRGLLVGGDVIDMDDNDLDIAASMMAGLSLGRSAVGDEGNPNMNTDDLLAGIAPQEERAHTNYMFDDPLGEGRFGKFDGDDGDDSDDSSDDESGLTRNSGDSGGGVVDGISYSHEHTNDPGSDDVPVMDLFAGNFEAFDDGGEPSGGGPVQSGEATWSNFANFDDAFAGQDASDAFGPVEEVTKVTRPAPENGDVDEIFGGAKDHAILLEETDKSNDKDEMVVDVGFEDQPVIEGVVDDAGE